MKKLSCVLIFAASFMASTALCGEMDLFLRSIADGGSGASWSKSLPEEGGYRLVPCFLKTSDPDATASFIEKTGGRVGVVTSGIVAARIPSIQLRAVSDRREVVNMEFAALLSSKMNTARAAGEVDVVQDGSALGTSYQGMNVVVGVVDDGLDYGHPDFVGPGGGTRVQYVRQQSGDEVAECTKGTIINGNCSIQDDGQGFLHGSHVTGIAAGSDSTYTGVAPKADIMFAFLDIDNAYTSDTSSSSFGTDVLENASAIFDKADKLDKAAVINLSLGTSIGAHDGTSLLEQGLSELTSNKVGRIIVGAAGNEQAIPAAQPSTRRDYVGGIHSSIDVADGSGEASRIGIWNGSGSASTFTGGTLVDIWLTSGQKDNCSVAIFGYSEGRSAEDFSFPGLSATDNAVLSSSDIALATDSTSSVTSDDSTIEISIAVDDSDIRNEKPHVSMLIMPKGEASSSSLERFWFDVVVRASGGDCSGHMWLYYDYTPYHDFLMNVAGKSLDVGDGARGVGYALADGDSFYTMTIPATATGVIAVGSWLAEKPTGSGLSEWTGANGTTYDQSNIDSPGGTGSTIGDLSSFSSLGPTADGRTKPDIVAPGEPIISAKARGVSVSSSIGIDDNFYKNAGTSMASPYVTGVVALLLERNNTLGPEEVRAALQTGAKTDGLTSKTADPANSYGAGKVDAAAVLASVIPDTPDTSAYHGTGDLDSSGGGCSLVLRDSDESWLMMILSSISLWVLLLFRVPSSPSRMRAARRRRQNFV